MTMYTEKTNFISSHKKANCRETTILNTAISKTIEGGKNYVSPISPIKRVCHKKEDFLTKEFYMEHAPD